MRKLASVAIAAAVTFGAASCSEDQIKDAVNSVGCSALDSAAKGLALGDNITADSIKQLADGAKKVSDALGKLPTDKLPAGAADTVKQAATQLESAAAKADSDPEGAKADVDAALAQVNKVVEDAKKQVGC
jgi:hypothetical protein